MNIIHALPLMLACVIATPAIASDMKFLYAPPESIQKQLTINSHTEKTVTFRFDVKSLVGNLTDLKLSAKVLGNNELVPVPNIATFTTIAEGQSATLDFVLPITEEQIKEKSLKIQGTVQYTPDYESLLKVVEEDAQKQYQNVPAKERLINTIKSSKEKNLPSTEATRFVPSENKAK